MKQGLYSYNEIVKVLQKGLAVELHYYGFDYYRVDPAVYGYDYEFEQLPVEIFICQRLRDFPNPFETFQALGGHWGEGVEVDAYAVPKLQSQR